MKKANLNKTGNIFKYADNWMKDKTVTKRRQEIMEKQLHDTILKIRITGQFN